MASNSVSISHVEDRQTKKGGIKIVIIGLNFKTKLEPKFETLTFAF